MIFQASCLKVRRFPSKMIVNFIENSFKIKILVVGYPLMFLDMYFQINIDEYIYIIIYTEIFVLKCVCLPLSNI